jgi:hypothetical protein
MSDVQTFKRDQDLLTVLIRLNGMLEGLGIIANEYDFDSSREANAIIANIEDAIEKSQIAIVLVDSEELKLVA